MALPAAVSSHRAWEPILRTLDTIRIQDAVLAPDGSEPEWPRFENGRRRA